MCVCVYLRIHNNRPECRHQVESRHWGMRSGHVAVHRGCYHTCWMVRLLRPDSSHLHHSHTHTWKNQSKQVQAAGRIVSKYAEINHIKDNTKTTTAISLWPLYRPTCINRHLQLRTRGFCWCKVLLPACPCWRQPAYVKDNNGTI